MAGRPRKKGRAECGTDSGYYRHIRGKPRTPVCDACRIEHNRVTQARKNGKVA